MLGLFFKFRVEVHLQERLLNEAVHRDGAASSLDQSYTHQSIKDRSISIVL